MTNNENELKFLELARKKIFTVFENGEIYKTRCRLCHSECLIKANIRLEKKSKYYRMRFNYDKKRYTVSVHRAVYIYFQGEIPDGMQVNHKDGNKLNNAIFNLELVTPKENILHAIYVLKTFKSFGVNHLKPRLKPAEIAKILYYRKLCGFTQKRLAERFDVSTTQIRRICKFSTWRDLLKREDSNTVS